MDIRVAAYAVIIEQGRMLLAHWNEGGYSGWTLPGGGLEEGEDPSDAAVREVAEETGYAAELDELIGIDSHVVPAENRIGDRHVPLHALRIVYRAHVVGGDLTNELEGTTDEAAWFPLDEIGALTTVSLVGVGLNFAKLI